MKESERNVNNLKSLAFWFYNPITIAISSRGNAESLMSLLVLVFIYFLLKKQYLISGIMFAVIVHFKIYPITYSFAILFNIVFNANYKFNKFSVSIANLLKFGLAFLAVFSSVTYYFYLK
jgi:phosphatidylinositol glycan class M